MENTTVIRAEENQINQTHGQSRQHLLEMADMICRRLTYYDRMTETDKLRFLRERVRRMLRVLKAANGPWEETLLQAQQETACFFAKNAGSISKVRFNRICENVDRRNTLVIAAMQEQTVIGCQVEYYIELDKAIERVLSRAI